MCKISTVRKSPPNIPTNNIASVSDEKDIAQEEWRWSVEELVKKCSPTSSPFSKEIYGIENSRGGKQLLFIYA